jgi:hypothetical protein
LIYSLKCFRESDESGSRKALSHLETSRSSSSDTVFILGYPLYSRIDNPACRQLYRTLGGPVLIYSLKCFRESDESGSRKALSHLETSRSSSSDTVFILGYPLCSRIDNPECRQLYRALGSHVRFFRWYISVRMTN